MSLEPAFRDRPHLESAHLHFPSLILDSIMYDVFKFHFVLFLNVFAICIDTFKYNQQMVCWEARAGRGVLCSTPP
jgi:hypothetical protein